MANKRRMRMRDGIGADGRDKAVNPPGHRAGGGDVDCGATNREPGSGMGDAVAGGGPHGKDLGEADVPAGIHARMKAQMLGRAAELPRATGDEKAGGAPHGEIVGIARERIRRIGGFGKPAERGPF